MQKTGTDKVPSRRSAAGARPRKKTTSANEITHEIERRILEGEMANGNRVNENALALEFGVGRTVVRDAVRSLQQSGLIRLEAHRGAIVRTLELSEVMDIYDAWAGLSRAAGRLAAKRANKRDIAAIEALHQEMVEVRDLEDTGRYHLLNQKFHSLLFEISGNPRLLALHDQISKEMVLFSRKGVVGVGSLRVSSREHALIVDAIKDADPMGAANALEDHILLGKQRIIDSWLRDQQME